jgi:hypothetical protein
LLDLSRWQWAVTAAFHIIDAVEDLAAQHVSDRPCAAR